MDADHTSQPVTTPLDQLAAAFLDGTLPTAAWTHEARLRWVEPDREPLAG